MPISTSPLGCKPFSSTRQFSSAEGINKTSTRTNKTRRFPKKTAFLLATIGALSVYFALNSTDEDGNPRNLLLEWAVGKPLNKRSFVPFTIISRDQISPTSFIITVKPKYARDSTTEFRESWYAAFLPTFMKELHSNRSVLEQAWEYGLWAVEFKQPQLQVAREYTPLPSAYEEQEHDLEQGYLRFLIRKMDGGEVSTYLSGLRVGDDVELRGPHLGFDLHARLGGSDKVVFLAGGTGIAPALQVVRALLDRKAETALKHPSVSIIWANRKRADCEGCDGLSALLQLGGKGGQQQHANNAVLSLLDEARVRHGDSLKYACTVDEEGSFITARAITDLTSSPNNPSFFSSFWGASPKETSSNQSQAENSDTCPYHSPSRLVFTGSNDDGITAASNYTAAITNNDNNTTKCQCHTEGEGGKNLLMISGPDGFISTFAGPKLWANRKELQGPLRGVVGGEMKKNPDFWKNWLVLKL